MFQATSFSTLLSTFVVVAAGDRVVLLTANESEVAMSSPGPAGHLPLELVGAVTEKLVECYVMVGSGWKLTTYRPTTDIDHKDIVVDERGGYRSVYLQVKSATHIDRRNSVSITARFFRDEIPDNPRFLYAFALIDLETLTLPKVWLIPSPDFNRLCFQSVVKGHDDQVVLEFEARFNDHDRWNPYRLEARELGARLLDEIRSTPPAVERGSERLPAGFLGVRVLADGAG